jgi:hypothetical protein
MALIAHVIPVLAQADEPLGVPARPVTPDFVRSVLETALEHHIDPPTRQQLIVDFLRHVSGKLGHPLARDLASKVSAISNVDALYAYLQTQLDECHFYEASNRDNLLLGGVASAVSGTVNLVPRKIQLVNEQLAANRYVGIGIQVFEPMKVMSAFEGGPAHAAGLRHGDIIESIDGKPTKGEPLATSVERLRGAEGTSVSLVVRAPGEEARELVIERRVVPLKTVEKMDDTSIRDDVTMVNILQITSSTVSDLTRLIDDLSDSVKTIVLDLGRTSVSETSTGMHSIHLLADALLDECELGELSNRAGSRMLRSEDGNILGGRALIFFYRPGANDFVDWLAANMNIHDKLVYFEASVEKGQRFRGSILNDEPTTEFMGTGVGGYESFAVDHDYYITLMSTRLTAKHMIRGQAVDNFRRLINKTPQAATQ